MKCKLSKLFFLALIGAFSLKGYSQLRIETKDDQNYVQKLLKVAEENKIKNEKAMSKALEVAKALDMPINGYDEKGAYFEISGYDFENDVVLYKATSNNGPTGSIQTSRAVELQSGGSLGLNLNGEGMIVGIWDGGVPRAMHLDLTPRVLVKDNSTQIANHPTHVAGTMISNGAANIKTKGYAPSAYMWANDWENDEVEMPLQASQGLILSNHSYGYHYFNMQLYLASNFFYFGAYDQSSRQVDVITSNNPYYLPVYAAGNDRSPASNEGGKVYNNKGGNDLLTGTGTAKNNVVVGAINGIGNYTSSTDIVPAAFTNYGPTDDFRIKPDIANKGVDVFSSIAFSGANENVPTNSGIDNYNGTSMAAPGVTGVFVLWQQYFKSLWPTKEKMRAASLKALMAHTANPATAIGGPDHRFGWGLIDAKKGAEVLKSVKDGQATLIEGTLENGAVYELDVEVAGNDKLIATLAWTDLPGVVNTSLDSSSPALVNDLDLRITRLSNNAVFYPWSLVKGFTNLYATNTVDNDVDVIEKIEYAGPVSGTAQAGVYKIKITHKGTLQGGAQNFSLLITGTGDTASNESIVKIESLKMYPNPVQDLLNLTGDFNDLEGAKVVIYDLTGKKVFENATLFENTSDVQIDLSGFATGAYLVEITKQGVKDVRKLMKK